MPLVALGVEHKSAPLAVREGVMLARDGVTAACRTLAEREEIEEVAILSTCNRTEVYLYAADPICAAEVAGAYLAAQDSRIAPYLQVWEDMDSAEHLFRVACGLESQVLGEPQILGQVREALETAEQAGTTGPNLHSLFRSAISCARQARAGTALGRVNPSLGSEAVKAAAEALGPLDGRAALVIGGGEMARAILEELRRGRTKSIFIANRTAEVAEALGRRFGATPVRLQDISRVMPHVDVLFSATSARRYVVTTSELPAGGFPGRAMPLLLFDLAIPRDVDPELDELDGVMLRDLDSLLPAAVGEQWDTDVRHMEGIVAAEVHEFMGWYLTRRVVPVIANLRSHVESVKDQELKRVAPQLAGLTEAERKAVESLTGRLIDKMFHHLVMRLRLAAQSDPKLVEAAEFFFLHGEGSLFPHADEELEDTPAEVSEEHR